MAGHTLYGLPKNITLNWSQLTVITITITVAAVVHER
jgi:hypothetical protein